MSHDKIRAATRKRMAETGESYAAARREVIREHQAAAGEGPRSDPGWFAIGYSRAWTGRTTAWLDTLLGGGPGKSGVQVGPGQIRVRMGSYKFDVPRRSVRSARRSQERLRGTTGVHMNKKGQLLVNGAAEGLVDVTIDPPCHTGRTPSTMFVKERVTSLVVSLVDPDGFIAAVDDHGRTQGAKLPGLSSGRPPCRPCRRA
jgi:hypothetical protein